MRQLRILRQDKVRLKNILAERDMEVEVRTELQEKDVRPWAGPQVMRADGASGFSTTELLFFKVKGYQHLARLRQGLRPELRMEQTMNKKFYVTWIPELWKISTIFVFDSSKELLCKEENHERLLEKYSATFSGSN